MPAWRELQTAFRAALLSDADAALAEAVLEDGLPGAARLRIYRHHVVTTLTGTLRAAYPVVGRLVGGGFFAHAADRYLRAHPPAGPCLFEYGVSFPDFLAAFPPCRELRYLPDVARLEWALHATRHAADALPIAPDALRRVPAVEVPRLTFRLDPSVTLLRSAWPVDRIWRANQPEREPAAAVDLGAGGVFLEVRRLDDEPGFRPLAAAAYAFRRALADGRCLGAAAEAGLAADPALDLALALHDLVRDGVLVGFAVAPLTEETT